MVNRKCTTGLSETIAFQECTKPFFVLSQFVDERLLVMKRKTTQERPETVALQEGTDMSLLHSNTDARVWEGLSL